MEDKITMTLGVTKGLKSFRFVVLKLRETAF
jgi:hypothetical protein